MKKISDIKLSELREFCKAYQIDHTLAMKFQHDLRYGTLEDETLNYIWSDSKGLRETLIKADTTPTQAELNEARQMFKTRIYEYLENGAT